MMTVMDASMKTRSMHVREPTARTHREQRVMCVKMTMIVSTQRSTIALVKRAVRATQPHIEAVVT